MPFTVLSWNVENFEGFNDPRSNNIAGFIRNHNPDVISIYELKDSHGGFLFAQNEFPGFFTPSSLRVKTTKKSWIMVNPATFDHVTVTQQHKFRNRQPLSSPGCVGNAYAGSYAYECAISS